MPTIAVLMLPSAVLTHLKAGVSTALRLRAGADRLVVQPIIEPATRTEPKQATIAFDRCPCCGGAMIPFAILLRPPPRPSFRQDTS